MIISRSSFCTVPVSNSSKPGSTTPRTDNRQDSVSSAYEPVQLLPAPHQLRQAVSSSFHPVEKAPHIAVGELGAGAISGPAARQATAERLQAQLRAWPNVRAVVGVVPRDQEATLVVASRDKAIEQPVL